MTQAIELPKGVARQREVSHLVDIQAAAGAVTALHAQARHAGEGVVATALRAADTLVGLISDDARERDHLRDAVSSPEFLALVPSWIRELRKAASLQSDTGACTVATALKLWSWTMTHFPANVLAADELAEAVAPLLAARAFALEVAKPTATPLQRDLSHVYAAHVSAQAGTTCAEIVFGYREHLVWDRRGCSACFAADELDAIEAIVPGFAAGGRASIDVLEADGTHPAKEGPCVRFDGIEAFLRMRNRLDGCLTGARVAKDRAAAAIGEAR